MKVGRPAKDPILKAYRSHIRYELGVRRQVVILRIGVVSAILLGLVNLVLHLLSRLP